MTISLIFNIVTFVCACVIFYNFRKIMRLYRKRCDMYDKLYKDYTELEMKNRDLFFEKNGLEREVLKLKETVRGLDLTENMATSRTRFVLLQKSTKSRIVAISTEWCYLAKIAVTCINVCM